MSKEPAEKPKYVLLITSDQHRCDSLGIYGNRQIRSPHLDGLAGEGTVFEHAYANNTVCVPSRACIQTGRYDHQHGVETMEENVEKTLGLPPWEITFMERLQLAGFRTAAFGKMHMFPPKGFHDSQLCNGQGARWSKPYGNEGLGPAQLGDEYATWLEKRNPGAYGRIYEQRQSEDYRKHCSAVTSVLPLEDYVDTWVANNTIDYFERHKNTGQPVFAWCGFCNPHTPYDAPKPYDSMYDPQDMKIPSTYRLDLSDRPSVYAERQAITHKNMSDQLLRRILAFYGGLCTMVDDLCGRLFHSLKKMGIYDETLIIFTTDHGDLMGDYGMFNKWNFFESVIRVPFIVKPAGKGARAKRVKDLVELIDIAPTILDYTGTPIPDTTQGASLRPIIEGAATGKSQILSEYTPSDRAFKGKCLRTNRYKYIHWMPWTSEELYDLESDPLEKHNLVAKTECAPLLAEMRTRMLAQLSNSEKPIMKWV